MPVLGALFAPDRWPAFVLITARLSGLFVIAPLWSMQDIPRLTRGAIIVVLAAMLLPVAAPVAGAAVPEATFGPMLSEFALGLALGLGAAAVMNAVAVAAEITSIQMGLSIGGVLIPIPELSAPGIGPLQGLMALVIYVTLGGHLMLIEGVARSFEAIPPGHGVDLAAGGASVLALIGQLFRWATQIAAPLMVAMLLTNLAVALLGRAVPQLNAMVISFPITIGLGFILFGAVLPLVAGRVAGWVGALPGGLDRMIAAYTLAPQAP